MRSNIAILFATLIVGLSLGCRHTPSAPKPSAAPSAISLRDALGRLVTLPRPAKRVVSLQPNNTEILFALGLGDRVVAVTKYCDYPPAAKTKPQVGDLLSPSVERILSFKPDLVLVGQGTDMRVVEALDDLHVPTFAVHPKTVEDVFQAIGDIGTLCGVENEAKRLNASLRARLERVTSKTATLAPSERPRVLYGYPEVPFYTASGRTFIGDVIRLAGGANVAESSQAEWPALGLEALIKADPEVIISGYSSDYLSKEEASRRWEALKRQATWQAISAVRSGRIYLLDLDPLLRPGPRVIDALEQVARCLHPTLFSGDDS